MHYSKHIYTYLFFAAGIVLVDSVAYLALGKEFFAVQVEVITNWFLASIITSLILIPTFVFGLVCLLVGSRFGNIESASIENSESVWAFSSGVLVAVIPVIDFVFPNSVVGHLMDPYVITWLPIIITSLAYLAISKYRRTNEN